METSQARPAMRCKRLLPARLKGLVEGASATVLLARAAADGHSPHRTESRSVQYRGLSSLPTKACTARRRALPDTSAAPRTLMLLTGPVWHRTVSAASSGLADDGSSACTADASVPASTPPHASVNDRESATAGRTEAAEGRNHDGIRRAGLEASGSVRVNRHGVDEYALGGVVHGHGSP